MATSPRLAGRYARSILTLAKEKNLLKEVSDDMHLLDESISNSKDLQLMLKSPVITPDKKESILMSIFGGKISEITTKFISLLSSKGREKQLAEVVSSFIEQYNKMNHIVSATLTTAQEADQTTIDKVTKLLLGIAGNESVELKTIIDPSIIGGFVLKYGDTLLDASVERKLQLIKKEIQDTSYINKL